jgi:hypothetical protein
MPHGAARGHPVSASFIETGLIRMSSSAIFLACPMQDERVPTFSYGIAVATANGSAFHHMNIH